MSDAANNTVTTALADVRSVLSGADDRLIVIVGPCSIHDPAGAIEYASKLKALKDKYSSELVVVMRVYFEKPRTTVGWKGLINDPDLNGTFNVNKGLRTARKVLLDINELGVPAATEFLDLVTSQYISDLTCWGAIGARTTESQVHREMVSGLGVPVGFKNGTSGDLQISIDACISSMQPHSYLGISAQGIASVLRSAGNADCHVILRGGSNGPNYDQQYVADAAAKMVKAKLPPCLVIDCSHGNSEKKFERQTEVAKDIGKQIFSGSGSAIKGVMIESNLVEGAQKIVDGKAAVYGQSVTDACIGWEATESTLDGLARAVQARRSSK